MIAMRTLKISQRAGFYFEVTACRRIPRVAHLTAILAMLFLAPVADAQTASIAGGSANVCTGTPPKGSAPSAGGVATAPLTVGNASHIVVMEYEAWFGPNTGIAPQKNVTTCLQSKDMQPLGGGYDSRNADLIARHIKWIEQTGVDAVTLDLTNNVSCIFDGDNLEIIKHVCPDAQFRDQQLGIRDSVGHLFFAWSEQQTRLKIVPLLGGFDRYALTPDKDDPWHRSSLEKEADWFGRLLRDHPDLGIIYEGKPLLLIYLGTPIDERREDGIVRLLAATGLDRRYTFRLIGGYLDSQPAFWAHPDKIPHGPIKIAPRFGFWSIVDRLNFWHAPPAPYYPTFNRTGTRIENMTASLATAGQNGWRCPSVTGPPYCLDAALRYCGAGYQNGCKHEDYETLAEFMGYARKLKPIFLILDQFNEFARPDEGWNANTNDDAEPTQQWEYSGLRAVIDQIRLYRKATAVL
jgi:hypothetical protein